MFVSPKEQFIAPDACQPPLSIMSKKQALRRSHQDPIVPQIIQCLIPPPNEPNATDCSEDRKFILKNIKVPFDFFFGSGAGDGTQGLGHGRCWNVRKH
jgi:hypothetical protein